MSGLTYEQYSAWRTIAEQYFDNVTMFNDAKVNVINPIKYYNFEEVKYDTELEVMKFDLRHVKTSDLILVNFVNHCSIGTVAELAIAYDKDIPIIGVYNKNYKFHPWEKNFCDKLFSELSPALDYIRDFYLI